MKYIMLKVKQGETTRMVPVIFPDMLVHEDVAVAIGEIFKQDEATSSCEPVSAGEVCMSVLSTSGKSETLNVEANEFDHLVIDTYNYNHGLVDPRLEE